MTPKLLSSQVYAVTSLDDSGCSKIDSGQLSAIFRREAARRGFDLQPVSHWNDGGIARFSVSEAVTFKQFKEMMDEISGRSKHSIYVALDTDFEGMQFTRYSPEKAATAVRNEAFLKSYPSI